MIGNLPFETLIGFIAGIFTSASMLPQLIKVLRKKEVADLSWLMICVLLAGVSLWVYYGILKEEWPIILSNGLSVIINLILLVCFFLYKRKNDLQG